MAKAFRKIVDSILFAGLKPGGSPSQARKMRWLGPLERILSAPGNDDPLYLTNRTWQQRARAWALIALPFLLVGGGVGYFLLSNVRRTDSAPKELTPAQVSAKMLTDLNQNIEIKSNEDLEVVEVRVQQGGSSSLVGTVRNRTDKAIAHGELFFDLADSKGSRVGAVSAQVEGIPAKATVPFQALIEQKNASFALVREVLTQ